MQTKWWFWRLKKHSDEPIHQREIVCTDAGWVINDRVEGNGMHLAESFIHLHPDVKIENFVEKKIDCRMGHIVFSIIADETSLFSMEESYYSPEFGIRKINKMVIIRKTGQCPVSMSYRIGLGE